MQYPYVPRRVHGLPQTEDYSNHVKYYPPYCRLGKSLTTILVIYMWELLRKIILSG